MSDVTCNDCHAVMDQSDMCKHAGECPGGLSCDVCGESDGAERIGGKVEVCRLCYMGVEHAVDVLKERAEKAEARVVELEHIEDAVLACQDLIDANDQDRAIDRLLTIYVGGAMARRLAKRTTDSVSDSEVELESPAFTSPGLAALIKNDMDRQNDPRRARLDPDGVAKPKTEIVAVLPRPDDEVGGTVHAGQATHYIARPTEEDQE